MRKLPLVLGCLLLGGCQGYYRVTNLDTGQAFYTRGWLPGMYGRAREIQFDELGTGDSITIRSSRVTKVSEAEATRRASAAPSGPR